MGPIIEIFKETRYYYIYNIHKKIKKNYFI